MRIDPTHNGIRTRDQFINECPIKPATVAKMNSHTISLPEGTVRATEKIRAITKFRIPVITPVAAVNSSGVTRS